MDYEWNVQPGATRRLQIDLPKGELPPWTMDEYLLGQRHRPGRASFLGFHTGQRRFDLITIRWQGYNGLTIPVV